MIKIDGITKTKTLGRFKEEALGASTNYDGEVTKAEYVKDENGKNKLSKSGNKQIKINVKSTRMDGDKSIPVYSSVTFYETDYSPKLTEITPKKVGEKEVLKKVNITFSNGGKKATESEKGGFGTLDVYNIAKDDGKISSGLSIFGGNVKVYKKLEGDTSYFIEDNNTGHKEFYEEGNGIKVTLKGIIEPIKDTEKFLKDNYNSENSTLKVNVFCFEMEKGLKSIPVLIPNVDEDLSKKIVSKIKTSENNLVSITGEYISVGRKVENTSKKQCGFGEYEGNSGDYIYESVVKVGFEDGTHKIKFFDKKCKVEIIDDRTGSKAKVTKKEDFEF